MRAFTTTMAKFFASMSANDHHKHVGKPAAIVTRVVFTLIALALPPCSALSKRIAPPTVTQFDAAQSAAPDAAAQGHEIPQAVARAITNGSLSKQYDLSFRMNPFYLRGDFNGDGNTDVAFLVQHRSTRKIGIAIVHGATDKVIILGAGVVIGNGGDDFEWMDCWRVLSKDSAAREGGKTNAPDFRGDALFVEKSEAASALIYWNGKRYVWSQQGD